ncbi:MAG TPA: acyl-CoA dehydrogenase family protein, partial [Stellaceae bacterium]|nr:acyl-CoA dehydrogenase family protein [Stellaceae bacterium]
GPFAAAENREGEAARAIFERIGGVGWLTGCIPAPESEGGGLDLRRACLLREALAYGSGIADVAFSEPWLASLPIALQGNAEQRARYLPAIEAGRAIPAFALSEPGAGSDVSAIATEARETPDGYAIEGRKTWTSNAGVADLYVLFARLEGAGISAFLVPGDTAGITLEERLKVLPPHTVGTLSFRNCRVPRDCLLGRAGEGTRIALTALDLFRPTVGAATLGFARRAFDEALGRSLGRRAFGKPIAEHQLIQQKLADMAVDIDAAALLVYRAAWLNDRGGGRSTGAAAMAKLFSTERAQEVVDQSLQIHGGMGVVAGVAVERLYREVRAFRIFDGTSEIQRLIIAKEVLRAFAEAAAPS